MTAVAYYAGLRPSEVVMLRAEAIHLPQRGWGRIEVTEADVSFDEPGEPKTGPRSVPIPPVLVGILRDWVEEHSLTGQALLFRTRTDGRPTQSNWSRSLHRAMRLIDAPPIRIYDCRHAAATTWLRAGVPLGEAAKRLGHSVETLVSNLCRGTRRRRAAGESADPGGARDPRRAGRADGRWTDDIFKDIVTVEIELEPEVEGWIRSLSGHDYAHVAIQIERLEELGSAIREPWSKPLGDGLCELRFNLRTVSWRISYYFAPTRRVVLVTCFGNSDRTSGAR